MFSKEVALSLLEFSQQFPISLILLALLFCLTGIILLLFSWGTSSNKVNRMLLGWGFILLATPLWIASAGIDYGVVYNILTLIFATWVTFMMMVKRNVHPSSNMFFNLLTIPKSLTVVAKKYTTFTLVVILLFCVLGSVMVALVITHLLPMILTNKIAFAVLLFPFVGAAFAVSIAITDKLAHSSAILFSMSSLASWLVLG